MNRKVLIFSEMFPKKNNMQDGIFVMNRLEKILPNSDMNIDFAPVSAVDKGLWKMIRVLTGRDALEMNKYIRIGGHSFKTQEVDVSFADRIGLLRKSCRSWTRYAESMAATLSRSFDIREYDLIHAHRVFPEGYAAYLINRTFGIPYVVTAHGTDIHTLSYVMPGIRPLIVRTLEVASKSVFVSSSLLSKAVELGYNGDNATIIPNGVFTDMFMPGDKSEARKTLGIYENEAKYVGFVGNLIPVKGVKDLPDIFSSVQKSMSKVKFLIVGDGCERNWLKTQLESKGIDSIMTGRVSHNEVAKWMNAMDVMAMPSHNEGWPCVALEAYSCGVPVIGRNIPSICEALGNPDVLIDEGNDFARAFSDKITGILNSCVDKDRLIERASEFDWEKIAQLESSMYLSVIRQNILL